MKNPECWRPTKFVMQGGRLRASRDCGEVPPSSRFIGDVLAERYQTILKSHAKGRLLDLGAGTVPLYETYRELVDAVTCVDWANSLHRRTHIDIDADLNSKLPLASRSYDTVLATDVLEHVYRPHVLFDEISRVLAPGGKLLLATPFLYWIHEAPHDYARYTGFMLHKFCEGAGLSVRSVEETAGSPEVILDLIGKHLAWSSALARMFARIAGSLLRVPGLAAASKHSARWFPQGYILVAQK